MSNPFRDSPPLFTRGSEFPSLLVRRAALGFGFISFINTPTAHYTRRRDGLVESQPGSGVRRSFWGSFLAFARSFVRFARFHLFDPHFAQFRRLARGPGGRAGYGWCGCCVLVCSVVAVSVGVAERNNNGRWLAVSDYHPLTDTRPRQAVGRPVGPGRSAMDSMEMDWKGRHSGKLVSFFYGRWYFD